MSYISCFNHFRISLHFGTKTWIITLTFVKLLPLNWMDSAGEYPFVGTTKRELFLSLCYFCQICSSPHQLLLFFCPHGHPNHYLKQKELRRNQNRWLLHMYTQLCFSAWHLTFIIHYQKAQVYQQCFLPFQIIRRAAFKIKKHKVRIISLPWNPKLPEIWDGSA